VQDDLETLKREQISAEMQMVEVLEELLQSFERSYSELVEGSKQLIMSFFTTARDLEGTFHATLVVTGQKLYDEKYNIEVCCVFFLLFRFFSFSRCARVSVRVSMSASQRCTAHNQCPLRTALVWPHCTCNS
jgi:hypothetical protein